jgi:hypothetical protein
MSTSTDLNPKLPGLLRARVKKLGLSVTVIEPEHFQPGLDYGPFFLCDTEGYHVWGSGLPAEGIEDALNCYERELSVESDEAIPACWKNFGKGWVEFYAKSAPPPV